MLSVVIPMYNSEKTVADTLASILEGVKMLSEVLVVDDCSLDASRSIVSAISKVDDRVKLLVAPRNIGPGPARNLGLERATSPYVSFFDADDIMIGQSIDVTLRELARLKADMAICPYNLQLSREYNTTGRMQPRDQAIFGDLFKFEDIRVINPNKNLHILTLTNYPWNKIFETNFAKRNIKFPDLKLHEDIIPHWNTILSCDNILFVNSPIANYFCSPFGLNASNVRSFARIQLVQALRDLKNNVIDRAEDVDLYHVYIDFSVDALLWAAGMVDPDLRPTLKKHIFDFLSDQPKRLLDMSFRRDGDLVHRVANLLELT